jgi:hypothetical protein
MLQLNCADTQSFTFVNYKIRQFFCVWILSETEYRLDYNLAIMTKNNEYKHVAQKQSLFGR